MKLRSYLSGATCVACLLSLSYADYSSVAQLSSGTPAQPGIIMAGMKSSRPKDKLDEKQVALDALVTQLSQVLAVLKAVKDVPSAEVAAEKLSDISDGINKSVQQLTLADNVVVSQEMNKRINQLSTQLANEMNRIDDAKISSPDFDKALEKFALALSDGIEIIADLTVTESVKDQ